MSEADLESPQNGFRHVQRTRNNFGLLDLSEQDKE